MSQLTTISSLQSLQSSIHSPLNTREALISPQAHQQEGPVSQFLSGVSEQGTRVTLGTQASFSSSGISFDGVNAYQAVSRQAENNPYANNILNAISGQLNRDKAGGASQEELQSRLEAGLSGFLDGFGQAFNELEQSGLLSNDIQSDIEGTRDQVLAGLKIFAEQSGLSTSSLDEKQSEIEAVKNNDSKALEANNLAGIVGTQFGGAQASLRDFSFSLQTADGDTVNITASAYNINAFHSNGSGIGFQSEQGSSLSLSVDGDLDEDELNAINDLLSQVAKLSESFFKGDVLEAFDQALNIGIDSEEITRFALNLKSTDIQRVSSSYNDVANGFTPESSSQSIQERLAPLGDFNRDLLRASVIADLLGQDQKIVADLVGKISETFLASHNEAEKAKAIATELL